MRRELSCVPLALLLIAAVVPLNAQNVAGAGSAEAEERVVWVAAGARLQLECALRPEQAAAWTRDGGALAPDLRADERAARGGVTARLSAPAARPAHAGVYRCAPGAPPLRVALLPAAGAGAAADEAPIVVYELGRSNITLDCSSLTNNASADIVWSKNGTALEKLPELAGRYALRPAGGVPRAQYVLTDVRTREDDHGNYTCALAGEPARARVWRLHARARANLPANTNVVEGQRLKLTCKLFGRPYPAVRWLYSNSTDLSLANTTGEDVEAAFGARLKLQPSEQGVEGAELLLEPAQRGDAGWFRCEPEGGLADTTVLRVKDMYAALWPFLGICAEVFVLCAIILVYEKRRTKTELDDSDTDNHDQKKS